MSARLSRLELIASIQKPRKESHRRRLLGFYALTRIRIHLELSVLLAFSLAPAQTSGSQTLAGSNEKSI
jgi:hypothetical protein